MKISTKRVAAAILAAGMLAVTAAGCGETNPDTTSGTVANTADKHANVGFFLIQPDLDPANDYNGWTTSRLGVGECLIRLDDDLKIEGTVADTWENVDQNTWKFHIRDGIKFSNGKEVTAEDAKFSIDRAVQNNTRAAEYLHIASTEANGQELTIRTSEPNGALLNNLADPLFQILDKAQGEEAIKTAPVSTGPYVVKEFVSETKAELVKNEHYWKGSVGLDTISVRQIADANARAMALQSGEIDLTNTIDHTSLQLFGDTGKYTISSITSPRVQIAYMNNDSSKSPLGDIQLRKAVSYAVDRESYADLIGGSAAHSCYSDATPFGMETIQAYTFDQTKAKELLAQAGYQDTDGDGYVETPNGEQMVLRFCQMADHGSSDSAILAQAIQSDLKNVGIHMEIQSVENLADIQTAGTFDFYTANDNSAPTGDPQVWLATMYTKQNTSGKTNVTGFADEKIDGIVKKMDTEFDIAKRYELAHEAAQILVDDAANLFLTNVSLNMVGSVKLQNVKQSVCDYYFITSDLTLA